MADRVVTLADGRIAATCANAVRAAAGRHPVVTRGAPPAGAACRRSTGSCCATCGRSRGQAIAIALVVAAGIALFVSMFSTFDSLDLSLRTYYDRYRFADVFVSLTRAPLSLAGGDRARFPAWRRSRRASSMDVTLDVAGHGRAGHRPADLDSGGPAARRSATCSCAPGGRSRPAVPTRCSSASRSPTAHGLAPGRRRRRHHQRPPPRAADRRPRAVARVHLPDPARRTDAGREALRRVLDGAAGARPPPSRWRAAFNDVVLKLMHGASEPDVIARLDRLLDARLRRRRRDPACAAGVELVPGQRARRSCGPRASSCR